MNIVGTDNFSIDYGHNSLHITLVAMLLCGLATHIATMTHGLRSSRVATPTSMLTEELVVLP